MATRTVDMLSVSHLRRMLWALPSAPPPSAGDMLGERQRGCRNRARVHEECDCRRRAKCCILVNSGMFWSTRLYSVARVVEASEESRLRWGPRRHTVPFSVPLQHLRFLKNESPIPSPHIQKHYVTTHRLGRIQRLAVAWAQQVRQRQAGAPARAQSQARLRARLLAQLQARLRAAPPVRARQRPRQRVRANGPGEAGPAGPPPRSRRQRPQRESASARARPPPGP